MSLSNRKLFDQVAGEYAGRELHKAEQRLLARFSGKWHAMSVLDLGVGAGRTSYTFAPLCKDYLGVDYSEPMIRLCKTNIGESRSVRFVVGDATNLSFLKDKKFDLIFFSFNGIDYVSEPDRIKILAEVRKHLKPRTGVFVFSTHSLNYLPFHLPFPSLNIFHPLRALLGVSRVMINRFRLAWSNRNIRISDARAAGRTLLQDGAHNFGLKTYYSTVEYQLEQLQQVGFRKIEVQDIDGKPLQNGETNTDPWLYYYCR